MLVNAPLTQHNILKAGLFRFVFTGFNAPRTKDVSE